MMSQTDIREFRSYGSQVEEIGKALQRSADQMVVQGNDVQRELRLSGNLLARLEAIHQLAGGLLGRVREVSP